jgi:hypothetical protein
VTETDRKKHLVKNEVINQAVEQDAVICNKLEAYKQKGLKSKWGPSLIVTRGTAQFPYPGDELEDPSSKLNRLINTMRQWSDIGTMQTIVQKGNPAIINFAPKDYRLQYKIFPEFGQISQKLFSLDRNFPSDKIDEQIHNIQKIFVRMAIRSYCHAFGYDAAEFFKDMTLTMEIHILAFGIVTQPTHQDGPPYDVKKLASLVGNDRFRLGSILISLDGKYEMTFFDGVDDLSHKEYVTVEEGSVIWFDRDKAHAGGNNGGNASFRVHVTVDHSHLKREQEQVYNIARGSSLHAGFDRFIVFCDYMFLDHDLRVLQHQAELSTMRLQVFDVYFNSHGIPEDYVKENVGSSETIVKNEAVIVIDFNDDLTGEFIRPPGIVNRLNDLDKKHEQSNHLIVTLPVPSVASKLKVPEKEVHSLGNIHSPSQKDTEATSPPSTPQGAKDGNLRLPPGCSEYLARRGEHFDSPVGTTTEDYIKDGSPMHLAILCRRGTVSGIRLLESLWTESNGPIFQKGDDFSCFCSQESKCSFSGLFNPTVYVRGFNHTPGKPDIPCCEIVSMMRTSLEEMFD